MAAAAAAVAPASAPVTLAAAGSPATSDVVVYFHLGQSAPATGDGQHAFARIALPPFADAFKPAAVSEAKAAAAPASAAAAAATAGAAPAAVTTTMSASYRALLLRLAAHTPRLVDVSGKHFDTELAVSRFQASATTMGAGSPARGSVHSFVLSPTADTHSVLHAGDTVHLRVRTKPTAAADDAARQLTPPDTFQLSMSVSGDGDAVTMTCCCCPAPDADSTHAGPTDARVLPDRAVAANAAAATAATGGRQPIVLPATVQPPIAYTALERGDSDAALALVDGLKTRGYVRLTLPPALVTAVQHYHTHVAAPYFAADCGDSAAAARAARERECGLASNQHRYGYFHKPSMGKELFQVRVSGGDAPWPGQSGPAGFRAHSEALYATLKAVGVTCFRAVGRVLCDDPKVRAAYWDTLCDGETATDDALCSTLLDVFHYYAAPPTQAQATDSQQSCAPHTDYGLLTLIPAQRGGGGLQLLDWATHDWVGLEHDGNATECVVFASESLARLTGGFLNASLHKVVVSPTTAPRLSTPLLLFANPNRALDPRTCAEGIERYKRDRVARLRTRYEALMAADPGTGTGTGAAGIGAAAGLTDEQRAFELQCVMQELRMPLEPPPPRDRLQPENASGFVLSQLAPRESITFGYAFRATAEALLKAKAHPLPDDFHTLMAAAVPPHKPNASSAPANAVAPVAAAAAGTGAAAAPAAGMSAKTGAGAGAAAK